MLEGEVTDLMTAQTSVDIRKFRQERNCINVMYVAEPLAEIHTLPINGEFIPERNHTNVMSVADSSVCLLA